MEGNFDVGSGDEDSDDEGLINDQLFGEFHPIPPGTLTVVSELMDDLFTGISSKRRWTRVPEDEHLRFLLHQVHNYDHYYYLTINYSLYYH